MKRISVSTEYAFVPPVPGRDRENCFVYRTIEDLEAIRTAAKDSRIGTVIGGGLLGLEAAKALRDLNLETHVVEFAPRLTLPLSLSYDHRVIDGAEAARFNAYLGALLADFRRVIL